MDEFRIYLKLIGDFPDFRNDPARVSELVEKTRDGDQAATLSLMESTLKYIATVTVNHCHQWSAWPTFNDLVQEANTEILDTIEDFDPLACSLEAFIRKRSYFAFVRFWHQSKTVHLTDHGRKALKNMQRVTRELTTQLDRPPTFEELSEHISKHEPQIKDIRALQGVTIVAIDNEADHAGAGVVNLDSVVFDGPDPIKSIEARELREILVKCLNERDADLLLTYYDSTASFRELYSHYRRTAVSPEAARKAKERLLKKLRKCPEARELFNRGGVR
jgi:DNA-directed RNA polymerase specialized sigma subunit